jgi:hypothetical protein
VFIFLPNLLSSYFVPLPQIKEMAQFSTVGAEYLSRNWHWQVLLRLVNAVGAISIILVLSSRDETVGGAIARAFRLLPAYFLAVILSDAILFLGIVVFVLPFLYFFGRLAVLGPVVVTEGRTNPIEAIRRSFEVTKGFGWAVIGLVAIIFVVGMLLGGVVTVVLGAMLVVLLGKGLGGFLLLIVNAAATAALATVLTVLYVAIYRRLAGQPAAVPSSGI